MGMDVKVQTRVLEPFFTTKPTGKGTGLGLSTVYGILRQANGHITFTSRPGRGTSFRIFLPRIDLTQPASPRSVEVESALGGRETVLLVEDDFSVRGLIRAILDSHGYRVIAAAGPHQAEAICRIGKPRQSIGVGCGHAGHQWHRIGETPGLQESAHESSLHVRLHRRCNCSLGNSGTGRGIPAETIRSDYSGAQGSRGPVKPNSVAIAGNDLFVRRLQSTHPTRHAAA